MKCSRCKGVFQDAPMRLYTTKRLVDGTAKKYFACLPCYRAVNKIASLNKRNKPYHFSAKTKLARANATRRYYWANRHKCLARARVQSAIRQGALVKPSICEACTKASPRIEAHHENYEQPLLVQWLCKLCHSQRTFQAVNY